MNVETTIVQVEQVELTDRAPQELHHEDSELRPLAYETLGMVGGGSSIVYFNRRQAPRAHAVCL